MDFEDQRARSIALMLGMNDEDIDQAELEVAAATVEAEESLKVAIDAVEAETGRKAFIEVDGEKYVSLGVIGGVLSGIARAALPSVLAVAMGVNKDERVAGKLDGINTCVTLMGAVVTVAKERLSE